MKLQRIKPRLASIATTRLPTLQTTAGATPRLYGDTWMAIRRRIMQRDKFACAACGLVRSDHEVDHITPLCAGGSNEDSNMQLLCSGTGGCHSIKSATEAKGYAGQVFGPAKSN